MPQQPDCVHGLLHAVNSTVRVTLFGNTDLPCILGPGMQLAEWNMMKTVTNLHLGSAFVNALGTSSMTRSSCVQLSHRFHNYFL
jgi:hypothetical protein